MLRSAAREIRERKGSWVAMRFAAQFTGDALSRADLDLLKMQSLGEQT